jgi:biotin carboxyl carrier protein
MKKYVLTIDNKKFDVDISVENNSADVLVNGYFYKVEIEKTEEAPEVKVKKPAVQINKTDSPIKKVDHSENIIISPLPGVVLDVHVRDNDTVKKGDLLVILESMKMENNILAGHDGIVKSIFVHIGETVKLGDALLEVEDINL